MNFDNITPPSEYTEEQKKAVELQRKMNKAVILSVTAGVLITLGLGIITVLLLLHFGVFTFNKNAFDKDKKENTVVNTQGGDSEASAGSMDSSNVGEKLSAIESVMEGYYYGDVDKAVAEDAVCKAYVEAYGDEYSTYYNSQEYEKLSESIQGAVFYGVGILCRSEDDKGLLVLGFSENSSAEEAGIKEGDHILFVDDKDIRGMSTDAAITELRAEDESEVRLKVLRGEEELEFTVGRRPIDEVYVNSAVLDDGITGYIRIREFTSNTPDQFASALKELKDKGIERLIIDLRNNTGGVVSAAINILDQLLPECSLGGMQFSDGTRKTFEATDPDKLDIPFIVMCNQYTASASEIFAAAIQDHKAAPLVGTTTFGKGITQRVVKLTDGSAVKYTDAELYSPDHHVWNKKGLTPDVESELPEDATEDTQLLDALEVFKRE